MVLSFGLLFFWFDDYISTLLLDRLCSVMYILHFILCMTLCGQCSLRSLSLITRARQTPRISCIAQPGLVFDSFALSPNHYEYHESRIQVYLYGFKDKFRY